MNQNPSIAYNHYKRYKRKYAKLIQEKTASFSKLEFLRKRILRLKEFLNGIILQSKLAATAGAFGLVLCANTSSAQSFGAQVNNPLA